MINNYATPSKDNSSFKPHINYLHDLSISKFLKNNVSVKKTKQASFGMFAIISFWAKICMIHKCLANAAYV